MFSGSTTRFEICKMHYNLNGWRTNNTILRVQHNSPVKIDKKNSANLGIIPIYVAENLYWQCVHIF